MELLAFKHYLDHKAWLMNEIKTCEHETLMPDLEKLIFGVHSLILYDTMCEWLAESHANDLFKEFLNKQIQFILK